MATRARNRTVRQWSRAHPFLLVGLGSFLPLLLLSSGALRPESLASRVLVALWHTLGFGPHMAANLLARLAPEIHEGLDTILVIVLGLLPYLAADTLLAKLRARVRARNLQVPRGISIVTNQGGEDVNETR